MMRQKLALVVCVPPSVALRRMNGFSPVRITWLGSAAIGVSLSGWRRSDASSGECGLRASPIAVMLRPRFRPAGAPADEHRIVDLEHAERPQDHGRARGDGAAVHDQAGPYR